MTTGSYGYLGRLSLIFAITSSVLCRRSILTNPTPTKATNHASTFSLRCTTGVGYDIIPAPNPSGLTDPCPQMQWRIATSVRATLHEDVLHSCRRLRESRAEQPVPCFSGAAAMICVRTSFGGTEMHILSAGNSLSNSYHNPWGRRLTCEWCLGALARLKQAA